MFTRGIFPLLLASFLLLTMYDTPHTSVSAYPVRELHQQGMQYQLDSYLPETGFPLCNIHLDTLVWNRVQSRTNTTQPLAYAWQLTARGRVEHTGPEFISLRLTLVTRTGTALSLPETEYIAISWDTARNHPITLQDLTTDAACAAQSVAAAHPSGTSIEASAPVLLLPHHMETTCADGHSITLPYEALRHCELKAGYQR